MVLERGKPHVEVCIHLWCVVVAEHQANFYIIEIIHPKKSGADKLHAEVYSHHCFSLSEQQANHLAIQTLHPMMHCCCMLDGVVCTHQIFSAANLRAMYLLTIALYQMVLHSGMPRAKVFPPSHQSFLPHRQVVYLTAKTPCPMVPYLHMLQREVYNPHEFVAAFHQANNQSIEIQHLMVPYSCMPNVEVYVYYDSLSRK
mmetsp:Transcript_29325/g.39132  ORF Transcript_29325/g.39132 Transcript_29325/m.39132 type:complete len:200 (-) Transcript_29325:1160-1759(-)